MLKLHWAATSSSVEGVWWVKLAEVPNINDLVPIQRLIRFQLRWHPLEVCHLLGHSVLLLVRFSNRFVELIAEHIEALNVGPDDIQLFDTLLLRKHDVFSRLTFNTLRNFVPNEVHLLLCSACIGCVLQSDFLPEILDGHLDDAVLACLLQQLFCLVLVTDHKFCFLTLDRL